MPPVTVGVPVYNGASLIRESLENLAAQTYRDFSVVISDNASTDGTSEICAEFAARDSRFRHVRADVTSDAMTNFFRVRDMAASPYFMWRAFDDLSSPDFIEGLLAVHEANPGIALAVPAVRREYGARKMPKLLPYLGQDNAGRLTRILSQIKHNQASWFYGLWRHEDCVRITDAVYQLFPDTIAGDQLILFYTSFMDGIRGSNNVTFTQRLISEYDNYIMRYVSSYKEMSNRNWRFYKTCQILLRDVNLTSIEKYALAALLPWYAYKRPHKLKRLLNTRIREWRGGS